jgi:hypothetical protein
MTLAASTYFEHLKAYVNSDYVVHDGSDGKVILTERYFRPEDTKPQKRNIELLLPGSGMAFKLDHDDFETAKRKNKPYFTFWTIPPSRGRNAAISSFSTSRDNASAPIVLSSSPRA